jgi:CheY-like chemotaxis protein
MLAHELRNPLAPICTGLEVLRLRKDDPAALERSLGIMERQTRQLTRLIDDLMDVSRITRGRLQVRKGRVELADVVQSAIEASRPLLDEAGHELTVRLPDHPIVLDADATRLAQVLSNLLGNAAKYTPHGGRVVLSARTEGDELVVSVADSGVGIPPAMLGRVFEMFQQVERPGGRATAGLGIGLTLVRALVEAHGGTVSVHSEGTDRGSEFVLRLPLPPPTRAHSERETGAKGDPAAAARGARPRRVLVVDDNEEAAEMLSMAVEMLGNEVRTARDGIEAVELAGQFRPNVVLMDIGMPRMNGYDAARRIREQPWGKDMLLVALTGWGQEDDKRKTREAGFDRHLVKPAGTAALEVIFDSRPEPG